MAPPAVLDHVGVIPDDWRECVTEERTEFEAIVMTPVEPEFPTYSQHCAEDVGTTAALME